ncbi:hypothetical protein D3C87_1576290 [compost metagenome]
MLPAFAFLMSEYQKPISRYEQTPTPSQPTNIMGRFLPSTSTSIEKVKRFR